MTSPHAAATEVLAAMATTEIDSGAPDSELTAVAHDTEGADENMKAEPEPSSETMPPAQNNEGEVVGGNPQEEQSHLEGAQDAGLAYIPDMDPNMMFGFPVTMAGELQVPAMPAGLDILSQFALPDYSNGIHDLGYLPVSAHGLPVAHPALAPVPQQSYLESSPYMEDLEDARISAYAKLEFEDGEFYMTTYSVVLGRDAAAAKAALRRDREEAAAQIEREAAGAQDPRTPVRVKIERSHHSRSIISEQGGILREGEEPESSGERERRIQRRKASKKSKSSGSSSHPPSRRASLAQPYGAKTYQPQDIKRAKPETAGARPVDPARLRPSPHDCPLIGIHPPASKPASDYKAISRKHVMIMYNSKEKVFEAHVLGRNGAFVLNQTGNTDDDHWYGRGCVFPLLDKTKLQIGGVVVTFLLPDVIEGQTGAEQQSGYDDGYSEDSVPEMYREGGKEMSFDFNETAREGALADTSEERSIDPESEQEEEEQDEDGSENGEEDVVDEEEEEEDEDNEEIENDGPLEKSIERDEVEDFEQLRGLSHDSQKKRGPGRPPKNGIMSKREQQLAKKEALAKSQQKAAKKTIPQPEGQQPVKNKVGRPRKHPRPDTPPVQREKRKYTKRKPKEPKDGEAKPNGSGGDDQPAKEKKEKKPPKPPRSPSPTFNEADLTPEQLTKPQANYVLLIYEALMESKNDPNKNGQMSLPQIYRAIQRKYPFFVVKATTNGWQSSVRHNLSQHAAFKKVERDGKGWMWAIVDGVSVEKEKKRRPTPPPQMPPGQMHHQPIYQAGHPPHMMPGYSPYGPGMMGPPPGYPMNHQIPPQYRPGQGPQYMGPPPLMNGQPLPQGPYPMNGPPPPGFVAALAPQLTGANAPGSYSSPYAPKPTVSSPPPSHEQPASAETKPLVQNQDPSPVITPQPIQQPQHPSQPQQTSQPQPPAPQVVQQAAPQPVHQEPPPKPTPLPNPSKLSEPIMRAIESFRDSLVKQLKNGGSNNANLLVDSAINRALGVTSESTVGNEHQEEQIVKAVLNLIASLPPPKPSSWPATDPSSSSPQPQSQSDAQANHYGTQVNATQPPANSTSGDKPSPAVMRPSFTGQSRANGPAVPRPPMVMKRANSGSPANPPARSSAHPPSPAPTASPPNGASTPKHPPDENGQLAGQKRPLDDPHDPRDVKRVSS